MEINDTQKMSVKCELDYKEPSTTNTQFIKEESVEENEKYEFKHCEQLHLKTDESVEEKLFKTERVVDDDVQYKCVLCDEQYTQSECLKTHLKLHIIGLGPYGCTLCFKKYIKMGAYHLHLLKHCQPEGYKCLNCRRLFQSSSNLIEHCRQHTREKPYKCELCDKCFTRKDYLKTHLKLHAACHNMCSEYNNYKCDICKKQ